MTINAYCLFLAVWIRLARKGACDDAGGVEFRRVLGEWMRASCPLPVAHFIRTRANIQAECRPHPLLTRVKRTTQTSLQLYPNRHELN